MEFGDHWLQPIQKRLATKFPSLSSAELDAYNSVCREAMLYGHQQVVVKLLEAKDDAERHYELVSAAIRLEYPWITKKNLGRLFSQGCYYALK